MFKFSFLLLFYTCLAGASDSAPLAKPQNNTWNSTYGFLNSSQAEALIVKANLSAYLSTDAILTVINYERSNWAGSSTQIDPFYVDLPANASNATAGSVLKIEQTTNTSLYTLPPNVALSRFLYTTKTLNGTTIPASAYVLWPWLPRQFKNITGLPVVGWAHGTSGWSSECAPSHIRNLLYHFSAPFTLALQGYVVVAPDYAGIGIDHDQNGSFIAHQYMAHPASGGDLIYSVQAAQKAWPSLSKEFVLIGHSQGGGAAWGAAQLLAKNPVRGYLGAVAASPSTSVEASLENLAAKPASVGSYLVRLAAGFKSIFPTFSYSDWLNDTGLRVAKLLQDLQGCQTTSYELLTIPSVYKQDWNSSWYFTAFSKYTSNGGKPFAGPLLVLQGTADPTVNVTKTEAAVNKTCGSYTKNESIEYLTFEGVTHIPELSASQQLWLNWIADRFNGVISPPGCRRKHYQPPLSVDAYQKNLGIVLEYPEYGYEAYAG